MADVNILREATVNKFEKFKKLLQSDLSTDDVPFWDIIVITGGDEKQAESYRLQLKAKLDNKEIPAFTKYFVFADPKGPKIGNGGATLHVLEQLEQKVSENELSKAKILLLHAGGYSQRLPHVSVIGKIFMALPFGSPMYLMLEMLLIMYIDFPGKMNPGVFVTASDIIFLFDTEGEWSFKEKGFTAIGSPESIQIGTTHGVYVPENMDDLRRSYKKDNTKTVFMCNVKQFLHKVTPDVMKSSGSIIPDTGEVYVDNSYYFDRSTAKLLCEFYKRHMPLSCEIDAYGDFLQALGPNANPQYINNTVNVTKETPNLVQMRGLVFDLLKGTSLKVILFHQGMFIHTGTTKEYLYHFCENNALKYICGCQNEVMVKYLYTNKKEDTAGAVKRVKHSLLTDSHMMHSIVEDPHSVSISKGCVIEFSYIEKGAHVQENCILSNLHVPANSEIPSFSYLHTVAVLIDNKLMYSTFVFDIHDNMKAGKSFQERGNLSYCKTTIEEAVKSLNIESLLEIWPFECERYNLWNAKLFPAFSSRRESTIYSIGMMQILRGFKPTIIPKPGKCRLALSDMLQFKSVKDLLDYYHNLKLQI